MAKREFETTLVIRGDGKGGVEAIRSNRAELDKLSRGQQDNRQVTQQQSKSWETMSTTLKGAAAAMGLSVAGLAALGKHQLENVANTDRLAKSIGLQTGQLQAMQYAAQFAGIEQDNMGDILKDVADKIGDAYSNGGGEAVDVLNNLGLSAQKLVTMSPDQQLLAIAGALDNLQTHAQRVNALEALGNDLSRLLPLLQNNGEEFRRLMERAYDLNNAMSQTDIVTMVEANNALQDLGASVDGLVNTFAVQLAPAITDSVDAIQDWIDEMGGMEVVVDRFATAIGVAINVAEVLFAVWLGRKAVGVLEKVAGKLSGLGSIGSAAMLALQRDSVGLNRALLVTQARTAAVAAAGRGLASVMGLLGGPAGVAILAASAMWQYGDTGKTAAQRTREVNDEVEDLTISLKELSREAINVRIAEYTANIISLQAELATAKQSQQAANNEFASSSGILGGSARAIGDYANAARAAAATDARGLDISQRLEINRKALDSARDAFDSYGKASTDSSNTEIRNLNKLLTTYDDAHIKLQQLRADRKQLSEALAEDPDNDALKRSLAEVDSQINQLTTDKKANTSASQAAKEAEKEHAQALKESADTYAKLYAAIDPAGAAQAEYQATLASLQVELREGTKTQFEYYAAVEQASAVYNNAASEADQYAQRTQSLLEQYDSTYRRSQDLDRAQRDLTERYKSGKISLAEYQRSMKAVGEEAKSLAQDSGGATEVFTSAWDDALDRVDEQFADTFTGVFDGTLDSFSDFADGLKDAFSRLLGELAYAAARNQIMVSLGMDTSGAGDGLSGMLGSGSGSGGGLSTQNLISGGRQTYNAFFGGSSAAGTGAVDYAGAGFGSQVATGSYTGWAGSASGAAGSGAGAGAAGSWGQVAGNAAIGYGASSLTDPYASSLTGIDTSGTGAQIGQAGGAAIGAYFGGPVGSWAGGQVGSLVGGVVDDIFGGHRKTKIKFAQHQNWSEDQWYGSDPDDPDYSRTTAFGQFGITDKVKLEPEDLTNLLDSLATIDSTLASVMDSDEIDAVSKELEGWKTKETGKSVFTDVIEKRMQHIITGAESAASDATDKLIERVGTITSDNIDDKIPELAQALQLGNLIDGLSDNVKAYAEGVVDETNGDLQATFDRLNTEIGNYVDFSAVADSLNLAYDSAADNAVTAANSLVTLAGSMDTLQQQANDYYSNFYSQAKQASRQFDSIDDALDDFGLSADSSMAQFRALVEAQDLNTQSGRETYNTLMSVESGFASLNQTLGQARDQIEQTYQSVLDRNADSAGLDYWMGRYEQGTSLNDIAASIGNSVEAMNARCIDDFADSLSGLIDGYQSLTHQQEDAYSERQKQLEDEREMASSLGDIIDSMKLSDDSILSTEGRFRAARSQYQQALQGDDASALRAAEQAYLQESASRYGQNSIEYARIYSDVYSGIQGLQDQYKDSVGQLDDLKSLSRQHLDAQKQAARTLYEQLQNEVDQLDSVDSMAQLVADLPNGVASSLADILAKTGLYGGRMETGTGGSSAGSVSSNGVFTDTSGFNSEESAINDLYQQYLGRNVDEGGLAYYADELAKGESMSGIADRIKWDASHNAFAKGGVFTNGVVSQPATFDMGLMGEAGPEAIMPLVQGPQGLAVRAMGGNADFSAMLSELRGLRSDNEYLRNALREISKSTKKASRTLDSWDTRGQPETRNVSA